MLILARHVASLSSIVTGRSPNATELSGESVRHPIPNTRHPIPIMAIHLPTASYSLTLRLNIHNQPGMLGRIASAIGAAGGDIGAVDIVGVAKDHIVRDLTVDARDEHHGDAIVAAVK